MCTGVDKTKIKEVLKKTDVNELCTRRKTKTGGNFYKLKNLTTFAASLKKTIVCRVAVLPELLWKNRTIICLTFEEKTRKQYISNLRLIRALALHFPIARQPQTRGENLENFQFRPYQRRRLQAQSI